MISAVPLAFAQDRRRKLGSPQPRGTWAPAVERQVMIAVSNNIGASCGCVRHLLELLFDGKGDSFIVCPVCCLGAKSLDWVMERRDWGRENSSPACSSLLGPPGERLVNDANHMAIKGLHHPRGESSWGQAWYSVGPNLMMVTCRPWRCCGAQGERKKPKTLAGGLSDTAFVRDPWTNQLAQRFADECAQRIPRTEYCFLSVVSRISSNEPSSSLS